MSEFELNKIFGAILLAGLIAMFSGFIAELAFQKKHYHEHAFPIEIKDAIGGGEKKETVIESILPLLAAADVERGKKLSKACAACHNFDKGGPNGIGPNMWETVGNKKGHADGFAYSDALLAMGTTWGYEELNKFLYKPKAYIKGTKMNYIGMKKVQDRADLIAWLRTRSDAPMPLPVELPEPVAEEGEGEVESVAEEQSLDTTEASDPPPADETPETEASADHNSHGHE